MKSNADGYSQENRSLLSSLCGPPERWNRTTGSALLALVGFWAVKVHSTWAAWGSLTIDSGHEMYIPALLAEGKWLYRDVWFTYGPASVYLNSYLFRLFGVHLNVLYWAGCLSALGSAIFLYLAGMRLSSWLVGWTAGAILLAEAFHPSLFCFPLPYAFAAVYGCLVGCLFLWLILNSAASTRRWWMFGAGTASALALLMKPEFGIAAYVTVGILFALRSFQQRSWKSILQDFLVILPGVVVCALVIWWMVAIAGVEFITQENIVSWPTSYFMKTYGKMWLARNGFSLAIPDLYRALIRTLPLLAAGLAAYCNLWWKRSDRTAQVLKLILTLLLVVSIVEPEFSSFISLPRHAVEVSLARIFFPQDMVLYVVLTACASWWYFWRKRPIEFGPEIPLALTFTAALAFRILMGMKPAEYPIYYNGPVVFCFLLLARLVIPHAGRTRRFIFVGEAMICLACLTVVTLHARTIEIVAKDYVPLKTDRGTIRAPKETVAAYTAAIAFMKEKAALGESVLSVPEDTSLYFLSGTYCPTRVYSFSPGAVAPGKMTDDTIREIEKKPVRYLLWSNRTFMEFGVPVFGKDFDQQLGDYLRTHYRPVRRLVPITGSMWGWTAFIWERKQESGLLQSKEAIMDARRILH
jgi:hypothetical protein